MVLSLDRNVSQLGGWFEALLDICVLIEDPEVHELNIKGVLKDTTLEKNT